jgi:hypothetical protein
MLKNHSKILSWLLLALIALRGLVPVGYMVEATADGLALVVCDSGIYKDSIPTPHQHHHDRQVSGHDHSICPFAAAAIGAPTPSLPVVLLAPDTPIDGVRAKTESFVGLSGPSRAQQPRAPPVLS